jgi:hypothetical protein
MLPRVACDRPVDCAGTDTEAPSQLGRRDPALGCSTDLPHIGLRELRAMVGLAAPDQLGISLPGRPPLSSHVTRVIPLTAEEEMTWLNARRIVATMADDLAVGDATSLRRFPREAVGSERLAPETHDDVRRSDLSLFRARRVDQEPAPSLAPDVRQVEDDVRIVRSSVGHDAARLGAVSATAMLNLRLRSEEVAPALLADQRYGRLRRHRTSPNQPRSVSRSRPASTGAGAFVAPIIAPTRSVDPSERDDAQVCIHCRTRPEGEPSYGVTDQGTVFIFKPCADCQAAVDREVGRLRDLARRRA